MAGLSALLTAYSSVEPHDDAVPRSGERWRDVYGMAPRPCGALTRTGGPCKLPGAGCGGRCKFHGGASTGPRTVAGRARAALNGRANRRKLRQTMHTEEIPVNEPVDAPQLALVPEAEIVPAPGHSAPRTRLLDGLLDAHLAGKQRWPLVGHVLKLVDSEPPLSRAELASAVGTSGCIHVLDLLVRRGLLVEAIADRRQVLKRAVR